MKIVTLEQNCCPGFSNMPPKCAHELTGKVIKGAVAGHWSTLVWDDEGTVFGRGYNQSGELGIGQERPTHRFVPIWSLIGQFIVDVQCSIWHTVFLTRDGRVFTCGSNRFGQLSNGTYEGTDVPQQVRGVLDDKFIIGIAVGPCCTFFWSDKGQVFSCGNNYYGQLGLGDNNDRSLAEEIITLRGKVLKEIVCGELHCLAAVSGDVYVWGDNLHCQLGDFSHLEKVLVPTRVQWMSDAMRIECGQHVTLILDKEKRVHVFGEDACKTRNVLKLNDPSMTFVVSHFFVGCCSCGEASSPIVNIIQRFKELESQNLDWFGRTHYWSTSVICIAK